MREVMRKRQGGSEKKKTTLTKEVSCQEGTQLSYCMDEMIESLRGCYGNSGESRVTHGRPSIA